MTQRRVEQWSGAAFLLTGILTIVFWFVHPDPSLTSLAAKASSAWSKVNTMFIVLIIANLFGLYGWYLRYYRKAGAIGFLAAALGTIGLAVFVAAGAVDAFVTPILAGNPSTQPLLDMTGPLMQSLGPLFMGGGLAFLLGFVLLGVAMLRMKGRYRWAGVLFIVSAPVLGLSPLMPATARTIESVIYGIACLCAGWDLWKEEA